MRQLSILGLEEALGANLPWGDVYFTPGYGAACEMSDGASWEVAIWDDGRIIYPYLKRLVDPSADESAGFDVVSPYGYAGTAVSSDVPASEVSDFRRRFKEEMVARGCVAEFQRCSDLTRGHKEIVQSDPTIEVQRHNDTIAIDLTGGYDACWAAAEGRARTGTRKARKKGYTLENRLVTLQDLLPGSAFRTLYDGTMTRVSANPYYLFCDEYYQRLHSGLEGKFGIIEVNNTAGEVVSAGLYFWSGTRLHWHLAGSTRESQRDGVGNLIYDGMIRWGCENGFELFHVGGGLSADDRLFFFKKSLGGYRVPFYLMRSIFNPSEYDALVSARAVATDRTVQEVNDTGYFPAYRG